MTTPISKTTMIAVSVFLLFVCAGLGIGAGLLSDSVGLGILVGLFPFVIILSAMIVEALRQMRARHDG